MSPKISMNPHSRRFWWRFSDYVLDGTSIQPAPDATLERYDPWEAFQASAANQRGGGMLGRPYLSLIELADSLREPGRRPSSGGIKGLMPWCREHGLLGLMFLELRQVTPYPRWEPSDPWETDVWPKSRTYSRAPTGWIESGGTFASLEARLLSPEQRPPGQLVPRDYWSPTWDEPGVLVQDLATGRFRVRKLEEALGDFFPSVPSRERETYPYPMPMSEEFCKLYAEDVHQFLDCARRFAGTVRTIGRCQAMEQMAEPDKAELDDAISQLQMLAAHSISGPGGNQDDIFRPQWEPTSLISCYASMALWDAAHGLLNVCDECNRVFVSSAGRARFCSTRCRKTTLQREWRVRKAQKEEGMAGSQVTNGN